MERLVLKMTYQRLLFQTTTLLKNCREEQTVSITTNLVIRKTDVKNIDPQLKRAWICKSDRLKAINSGQLNDRTQDVKM